ncbi:MAG TPA: hypothetical protein VGN12_03080 [Pirellulales bacterium]
MNSANPAGRAVGRLAGDWRYVYRNGRHWYWMPNQTWQLWNGASWQPYAPGMQSPTAAAYQSPRQMSGYRGGAGAYGDSTQATNVPAATSNNVQAGSATGPAVTRPSSPTGDDALKEIPDASGVTVP